MRLYLNLFLVGFMIIISQTTNAQSASAVPSSETEASSEEAEKLDPVFEEFTWLKDIIDLEDCQGTQIKVAQKSQGAADFVFVRKGEEFGTMYDANGKQYCKDHAKLDCEEFYELKHEKMTWTCE